MIRLANYSAGPFYGWIRTVTDTPPAYQTGLIGNTPYVLGRRLGVDTTAIDINCTLDPSVLELDQTIARQTSWGGRPTLQPQQVMDWMGGLPSVNGTAMPLVSLAAEGAGLAGHWRARITPLLVVDLWLWWHPWQPWMTGEVLVTCSNCASPEIVDTLTGHLRLTVGNARVFAIGKQYGEPLLAAGTTFADGQCRAFPVVLFWSQHASPSDFMSVAALAQGAIVSNGVRHLWKIGYPRNPEGVSGLQFSWRHMQDALASVRTWDKVPELGCAKDSGSSGSQEDQIFVGAECQGMTGLGAEFVRYLVALAEMRRPCHYREADGRPLVAALHPDLVMWDGRPHYHPNVNPDTLGKPRTPGGGIVQPTLTDTSGWWGPDVEHAFLNTRAVASRLVYSPALQEDLRSQAEIYLRTWTVKPGWSTTQPYAARAVGWEGLLAWHLWRNLWDRGLAAQVKEHWNRRATEVLVPVLGAKADDIWDVRVDDPRLGSGPWWMPWQQSLGAYGLDLAGEAFGHWNARLVARRAAQRVLSDGWLLEGGRWKSAPARPVGGLDGPVDWTTALSTLLEETGVALKTDAYEGFSESWNLYGMPLAVAVVLKHFPGNEQAGAIWAQLKVDSARTGSTWMPPEVQ